MAVKSFMKSGGIAALAAGLAAVALPASASAQERSWGHRHGADAGAEVQVQQQQPQQQGNAGNWQNRGNGEARGNGGNWQGRGDGGARSGNWNTGRPQGSSGFWGQQQVAPQAQVAPQVRQGWSGGDRSRWQQNQQQQQAQGSWNGQDRTWSGQNRTWNGQNRTWNGQNTWSDRNRTYQGQNRWQGNRTYQRDTSRWNNDWRRDGRYNWYSYRNTNRNVFNLGRYYSPYNNWSYRRLGIGFSLAPLFYSQNYWIDDPWQYRLPEAYGPYRWVRYYDDALLVDIYTGEVVDAIYDFFW